MTPKQKKEIDDVAVGTTRVATVKHTKKAEEYALRKNLEIAVIEASGQMLVARNLLERAQ